MLKMKCLTSLFVICCLLFGKAQSLSAQENKEHMHTYLALGDSYTIGEQVPSEQNFPHQTAALLREQGLDVADPKIIAVTGWTTDELVSAIEKENITGVFSFVTLLIGVNNQYRGRSVENFRNEFTEILEDAIDFAQGKPGHVFVLSIPDWGVTPFAEGRDRAKIAEEIDAYNTAKEEITKEFKCHWLPITESTRMHGVDENYLVEDKLHYSGKEYALWAAPLANMVKAALL